MVTGKVTWEDAFSVVDPKIDAAGIHVWPFDPSFPIDVRFFCGEGRHVIRLNRHNYCELLHVFQGEADLRIQDRCFRLRPNDLVVIGSNIYHGITWTDPIRFGVLYFEPELVRWSATGGDDVEYLLPFLTQHPGFPYVVRGPNRMTGQVLDLVKRIYRELPAVNARARLSVKTYLKMVLILLVNHYAGYLRTQETYCRKQKALDRLGPLFDYLEGHYSEPIRVRDAARVCAMSTSHLMCFFKQATGESFLSYVNHFRIAKAQSLLISTDRSVAEVSQELGFCDQSHFGQVFRKLVGMTPLAYRRNFARGSALGCTEPAASSNRCQPAVRYVDAAFSFT